MKLCLLCIFLLHSSFAHKAHRGGDQTLDSDAKLAKSLGKATSSFDLLNSMVQAVERLKEGRPLSTEEQSIFTTLNATIFGTTIPALLQAAQTSQVALNSASSGFETCNTELNAQSATAQQSKDTALAAAEAYNSRVAEETALATKIASLDASLQSFMSAHTPPAESLVGQSPSESLAILAASYKNWTTGYAQVWEPYHSEKSKEAGLQQQKASAKDSQTTTYCAWKTIQEMTAETYNTCWSQALSAYNTVLTEEQANTQARKTTFEVVHKLQCLLEVLTSPTAQQSTAAQQCESRTVDFGSVQHTEPSVPTKQSLQDLMTFGLTVDVVCTTTTTTMTTTTTRKPSILDKWASLPSVSDSTRLTQKSVKLPDWVLYMEAGQKTSKLTDSKAVLCGYGSGQQQYCIVVQEVGTALQVGEKVLTGDWFQWPTGMTQVAEDKALACMGDPWGIVCTFVTANGLTVSLGENFKWLQGNGKMGAPPDKTITAFQPIPIFLGEGRALMCYQGKYSHSGPGIWVCVVLVIDTSADSISYAESDLLVVDTYEDTYVANEISMALFSEGKVLVCYSTNRADKKHHCRILTIQDTQISKSERLDISLPFEPHNEFPAAINTDEVLLCCKTHETPIGHCSLISVSGTTPQLVSELATPDDAVRGRGLVRWWTDQALYCYKTSATIGCSVATCKTQQCSFSEPMSLAGTTHLDWAVVDSLVPGKAFVFSQWESFFIEAAGQ